MKVPLRPKEVWLAEEIRFTFRQLILHRSTKMAGIWEEIRGFSSPGEYRRFCTYIEGQIAAGVARERMVDPRYEKGMVDDGRWFEDLETSEIWRLVPPDFPFKGLWEKVDINLANV
jgi:hypothetical protein